MRVRVLSLVIGATLAGALWLLPVSASSAPSELLGRVADRARDCVGQTFLDKERPGAIGFVVWCGTESGKVRFTLQRREHGRIADFSRRLTAKGRGAGGFRCYRRGETVKCVGRKQAPTTVRGWIAVDRGTRCAVNTRLETPEAISGGAPLGCPGTRPPRLPRDMRYFRSFRREFGLDPDLHGNRAAIDRRIRGLIRAWERGDPTARYTDVNLGLPLRPRDQRELDLRGEYLEQTYTELEAWVPRHAAATYAGYDMDHEHGGIIYIGFVGDQNAQLAAFLHSFKPIAPGRIKPFPTPPRFSEAQLVELQEEVWEPWGSQLSKLINMVGINTLANAVEVGTEHVAKVKQLLAAKYGPEAPFLVVFSRPAVWL